MSDTIFMVHGMWVGGWVWEGYRRFFEAKGYTCTTPTLRYHDADPGAQPDPMLGTLSVLDYVADLERQAAALGTPPILMGHSMGGLLALMLATRLQVKALVLLAPAPPAGILALKLSTVRAFLSALCRWEFWRRPMRINLGGAKYGVFNQTPQPEGEAQYRRWVYDSARAALEIGFWFMDPRKATHVDPGRIPCPVLAVCGSHDRLFPPSVVRRVARKYGAEYKEFPDHAHWLLGEPRWEDVARYIASWLARAIGPPGD